MHPIVTRFIAQSARFSIIFFTDKAHVVSLKFHENRILMQCYHRTRTNSVDSPGSLKCHQEPDGIYTDSILVRKIYIYTETSTLLKQDILMKLCIN